MDHLIRLRQPIKRGDNNAAHARATAKRLDAAKRKMSPAQQAASMAQDKDDQSCRHRRGVDEEGRVHLKRAKHSIEQARGRRGLPQEPSPQPTSIISSPPLAIRNPVPSRLRTSITTQRTTSLA